MSKAAKSGGWIMLGGVLCVVAGMAGGFGPCGPSSVLGAVLFFGGMLGAVIGFLTLVIAAGYKAIRKDWISQS